jgi:hypothetical protein
MTSKKPPKLSSPTGIPQLPPALVPHLALLVLAAMVMERAFHEGPAHDVAAAVADLGAVLGILSAGARRQFRAVVPALAAVLILTPALSQATPMDAPLAVPAPPMPLSAAMVPVPYQLGMPGSCNKWLSQRGNWRAGRVAGLLLSGAGGLSTLAGFAKSDGARVGVAAGVLAGALLAYVAGTKADELSLQLAVNGCQG